MAAPAACRAARRSGEGAAEERGEAFEEARGEGSREGRGEGWAEGWVDGWAEGWVDGWSTGPGPRVASAAQRGPPEASSRAPARATPAVMSRAAPGAPSGLMCPTCTKLWNDISGEAFAYAYEMAEMMLKEARLGWEIKSSGGVCMQRELAKVDPIERGLVKAEPADDGDENEPLDQVKRRL